VAHLDVGHAGRSVVMRTSSVSVAKKSPDEARIRIQRQKWMMMTYVVVLVHVVDITKV
jgi:hypothetical protein